MVKEILYKTKTRACPTTLYITVYNYTSCD